MEVWGNTSKTFTNLTVMLQERAKRIINRAEPTNSHTVKFRDLVNFKTA